MKKQTTTKKPSGKKYIVRTERAGVFYASIAKRRGGEAELTNARRIHYWNGATECIGIALHGLGKSSRLTEARLTIRKAIAALPTVRNAAFGNTASSIRLASPWVTRDAGLRSCSALWKSSRSSAYGRAVRRAASATAASAPVVPP